MTDTMTPVPKSCAHCAQPLGSHRYYAGMTFTKPPVFFGPVFCSDACADRHPRGGGTADDYQRVQRSFETFAAQFDGVMWSKR